MLRSRSPRIQEQLLALALRQIEKMLNNQADALRYIDRAIELDLGNTEYSEFKKSLLQNN